MDSNVIVLPPLKISLSSSNQVPLNAATCVNGKLVQNCATITSRFGGRTFCALQMYPTPLANHARAVYEQKDDAFVTAAHQFELLNLDNNAVKNPLTKILAGLEMSLYTASGTVMNAAKNLQTKNNKKIPDVQHVCQVSASFEKLFSSLAQTGQACLPVRKTAEDDMEYQVKFQLLNANDKHICNSNLTKTLQYKNQQTLLHGKIPFTVPGLVSKANECLLRRQQATLKNCKKVFGEKNAKDMYCPWNFNCGRFAQDSQGQSLKVDSQSASEFRKAAVMQEPSTYMYTSILVLADICLDLTQKAGCLDWMSPPAQANIINWAQNAKTSEIKAAFKKRVNEQTMQRLVYEADPAYGAQMGIETLSADGRGGFNAHIKPVITEAQNKQREDQTLTGGPLFAAVLSALNNPNMQNLQGCDCEDGARNMASLFDLPEVTTAPQYVALMQHVLTYMPADYQSMLPALTVIAIKVHQALNEDHMNFVTDNVDTAENIACKLQQAKQKSYNEPFPRVNYNGEACVIASSMNLQALSATHAVDQNQKAAYSLSSEDLTPPQYTALWQSGMQNTGIAHNAQTTAFQGHCCMIDSRLQYIGSVETNIDDDTYITRFTTVHDTENEEQIMESTAVATKKRNGKDPLVHLRFKQHTPLTAHMQNMLGNSAIPSSTALNIDTALLAAQLKSQNNTYTITANNLYNSRVDSHDPDLAEKLKCCFYRLAVNAQGLNFMMMQTESATNPKRRNYNKNHNLQDKTGKSVSAFKNTAPGRPLDRSIEKTLDVGVYTKMPAVEKEVCMCLGALACLQTLSLEELLELHKNQLAPLRQRYKMHISGNSLVPVLGKSMELPSGMVVRGNFAMADSTTTANGASDQNVLQFSAAYHDLASQLVASGCKNNIQMQQGPLKTAVQVYCD